LSSADRRALHAAVTAILEGYAGGTRHGIHADTDGLLAAGAPGWQLTWMDARVDGREITPRIGKPVEVQALWINALTIGAARESRWQPLLEQAQAAFAAQFWNDARQCLFDVIDVDHKAGVRDDALRPNQVLAVGGLPFPVVTGERARQIVDVVERTLLTPMGLRSLAPGETGYVPHYGGGVAQRDGAYHQGTVWPWLIGPFVDAWLRTRRPSEDRSAASALLSTLEQHLDEAGLGHVSEVVDAEPPYTPGGCPFQAWSVGELIRARQLAMAAIATSSSVVAASDR
jgi:predicted glycogen debranching enzyme